ncbi:hypothetical protein D3C73_769450 [compost metagenome]
MGMGFFWKIQQIADSFIHCRSRIIIHPSGSTGPGQAAARGQRSMGCAQTRSCPKEGNYHRFPCRRVRCRWNAHIFMSRCSFCLSFNRLQCTQYCFCIRIPLFRMLAQQAPDHRNQSVRQSGTQLILQSGLPAAELAPGCHIQQQSPQTVEIRDRPALPSSILLRCGKTCCPEFLRVFIPNFF